MKEYSHIDTIWKRDMANNGKIMVGDFSAPEFKYLFDNGWVGTEKVDGTNIRVMWKDGHVHVGGKTDNAQIPTFLYDHLNATFTSLKMKEYFGDTEVCLYGEGFGAKIQKGGGNYIKDGVSFVLFDVKVGNFWLERDKLESIAVALNIPIVPLRFFGSLRDACDIVAIGLQSDWGDFQAEGLVLKPEVEFLKRNGERVIVKIKTKDFK